MSWETGSFRVDKRLKMPISHTRLLVIPSLQPSSIQVGSREVNTIQDTSALSTVCLSKEKTDTTVYIAISDNFWLIGEDKFLNPKDFFIIITALFGNGQSSSPSNQPAPGPFPKVSFYDNVRAQHELVTKHFGITHLRAV